MKWYVETTSDLPKHRYLLNDEKSKMFAYIKEGTRDVIEVKNERGFLRFDARYRTFKEIK